MIDSVAKRILIPLAALSLASLGVVQADDAATPWTLGEREGRQCLVTPEGKPFMMLGISHAGGALKGLAGADRERRLPTKNIYGLPSPSPTSSATSSASMWIRCCPRAC